MIGPAPCLRIVHVVCTDEFAGVERYVTTLARGLADRGCAVTVVGGDPVRVAAELAGTQVVSRPAATPLAAVRELLRHRRADVVHAHMTSAEFAAAVSGVVTGLPIVSTRHFAQHRGSSGAARAVGRVLTRTVAVQLAVSEFVARTTEGHSTVVLPGVPSGPIGGGADREPFVLVAQRLEREKRTDLALEVWARSGLSDRGWRLVLAGDGAQRGALEVLAARLGVAATCEFLGSRSDVSGLLSRASLFLAPRPDEPFGLAVAEAMAAGVPVVAAAGGGHEETVGLAAAAALFPADQPDAGGALLRELAADPGRRATYGAELQQIQRREFTVDRQLDQTLAVYQAVAR